MYGISTFNSQLRFFLPFCLLRLELSYVFFSVSLVVTVHATFFFALSLSQQTSDGECLNEQREVTKHIINHFQMNTFYTHACHFCYGTIAPRLTSDAAPVCMYTDEASIFRCNYFLLNIAYFKKKKHGDFHSLVFHKK
jgi:hypothetical protein